MDCVIFFEQGGFPGEGGLVGGEMGEGGLVEGVRWVEGLEVGYLFPVERFEVEHDLDCPFNLVVFDEPLDVDFVLRQAGSGVVGGGGHGVPDELDGVAV